MCYVSKIGFRREGEKERGRKGGKLAGNRERKREGRMKKGK
jgi:hypothetical protein